MSDLVLELRRSRPAAPGALRERIAELATEEPTPRRVGIWSRVSGRRAALILVPALLALAVLGAVVGGLVTSSSEHPTSAGVGTVAQSALERQNARLRGAMPPVAHGAAVGAGGSASQATEQKSFANADRVTAPRPAHIPAAKNRLQDYDASMRIRLDDVDGLSGATQRAMRLARRLGGYVVSVQYGSEGSRKGEAYLTLRVPITRVQGAIVDLSGLGTILAQNVRITDVQPQVDALERRILRLTSDIEAIDERLRTPGLSETERTRLQFQRQRLVTQKRQAVVSRRATINRARFATVSLDLTTEKHKEPAAPAGTFKQTLDDVGGILAAEAAWTLLILAVAAPFVVLLVLLIWGARAVRRMSDRRLLESG